MAEPLPPEEGIAPPPASERSDLKDLLGALLLLGVSLAFLVGSLRMRFTAPDWRWYTSPGIFALCMAGCLGGCSLAVGYRGLRGWLKARAAVQGPGVREALAAWGAARFLASVAVILAYLFLLGKIPFLLASAGLILVFSAGFRGREFRTGLRPGLVAAAIIAAFAYVIMKLFGIVFP
ncbi:MAG: tripartite tricarboxylate transporter TctB family protein [Candidatus Methylomirabilales bacterium]